MKIQLLTFIVAMIFVSCKNEKQIVNGGDERITFVGRTDRTTPESPRQWAAGAYFTFGFEGQQCIVKLNDENLYGQKYNIIEVVVDDLPSQKVLTNGIRNVIVIGTNNYTDTTSNVINVLPSLVGGKHQVTICRDTETGMGYTQLLSVEADKVYQWAPKTDLKIEFIGNSITSGAESDTTSVPASTYEWGDWHRAYWGYGPRTARNMNAQWALTSVSGIGLIHSCCNMNVTMPQVYDKYILCEGKIDYDFSDFQPDIICSCLGQNDGIQDSVAFCSSYVDFVKNIVKHNPQAKHIVLLNSPMDHGELDVWLRSMLTSVKNTLENDGISNVTTFFFSQAWNNGGLAHPSVEEHAQIASELTEYLKTIL